MHLQVGVHLVPCPQRCRGDVRAQCELTARVGLAACDHSVTTNVLIDQLQTKAVHHHAIGTADGAGHDVPRWRPVDAATSGVWKTLGRCVDRVLRQMYRIVFAVHLFSVCHKSQIRTPLRP